MLFLYILSYQLYHLMHNDNLPSTWTLCYLIMIKPTIMYCSYPRLHNQKLKSSGFSKFFRVTQLIVQAHSYAPILFILEENVILSEGWNYIIVVFLIWPHLDLDSCLRKKKKHIVLAFEILVVIIVVQPVPLISPR